MGLGKLFLPISIKDHALRNRVVLPPMVCFGWAGPDGHVTERHIDHYRKRAQGGAGLIIVEATCVTQPGRSFASEMGLWEDSQIEGFARIADVCHEAGATVLVQIHHGGYTALNGDAVCPSDWEGSSGSRARAMTLDELHQIQDAFVATAQRARAAGLDGVELHGAHGFLLCQFASPTVNHRQDVYGGSLTNRARFAIEIIERLHRQMPEDFLLSIRMGGNEPTVEEGIALAGLYEAAGIDIVSVSTGLGPEPALPEGFTFDHKVWLASRIREHVSVPVIAVGELDADGKAAAAVEKGYADMAAVARGFLADSQWALQMQRGETPIPCCRCRPCRWFKQADTCPGVNKG